MDESTESRSAGSGEDGGFDRDMPSRDEPLHLHGR